MLSSLEPPGVPVVWFDFYFFSQHAFVKATEGEDASDAASAGGSSSSQGRLSQECLPWAL